MGVIFTEPKYPVVNKAPAFWETVSNFNARDVGTIAGTTALSAPVGHLIGLKNKTPRPAMWTAAIVGGTAGFLLSYQASAARLMGFAPNDREVEKGLRGKR